MGISSRFPLTPLLLYSLIGLHFACDHSVECTCVAGKVVSAIYDYIWFCLGYFAGIQISRWKGYGIRCGTSWMEWIRPQVWMRGWLTTDDQLIRQATGCADEFAPCINCAFLCIRWSKSINFQYSLFCPPLVTSQVCALLQLAILLGKRVLYLNPRHKPPAAIFNYMRILVQ